tara:strand:+ start:206 stop:547 length:342 start_codon:yes stop_codon:yes gene_type:complete
MTSHTDFALSVSNTKKRRRRRQALGEYWIRKSMHLRVLPQTYKEIRKFIVDEEITLQGLLEYFMCLLLDDDKEAYKIVKRYKKALAREGMHVVPSDVEDIMKIIENHDPHGND